MKSCPYICTYFPFLSYGATVQVGHSLLIIEDPDHTQDTPHSVGLLWTGDKPLAQRHPTPTTVTHVPNRIRNLQSQQASGCRPPPYTARQLGSTVRMYVISNIFELIRSL